jgi:Domain of unknown function (DUF4190)
MSAGSPGEDNGTEPAPQPPQGVQDASGPPAYGPAGGYAWIDPWTGVPTARYQPPPGQPGYQWGYTSRNNPVAIAALVCGVAQFLGGIIIFGNILLAIPAVICGAIGLRQTRQRGERGRGMAIAGLVLGILGIVYFVVVVAVAIVIVSLHRGST